jgi:hypothetical protein
MCGVDRGGATDERGSEAVMSARRLAALAALCGSAVLLGWVAPGHLDVDSPRSENAGVPIEGSATSATPAAVGIALINAPQAAMGGDGVAIADVTVIDAALPVPDPLPPPETPPVQIASASTADPVPGDTKEAPSSVEPADACGAAETCIDRYLWSVYQRAPKLDTVKVTEQIKVTVKTKGKTRTVVKTIAKLVDEDFTWKDPKAAEKAGMPLMDYVIGGMDRSFKLKLYHALCAMDDAGFAPGMTSGFRDDYRQSLASGNKAANDRSYHGGSLRGGYGHGLAADLVSVRGETRAQRLSSSQNLWKWIDAHGKELGVGRPYLDRDPPHVGPIDGKEYADKRGLTKAKVAALETTRRHGSAASDDHGKTKRAKTASSKASSI